MNRRWHLIEALARTIALPRATLLAFVFLTIVTTAAALTINLTFDPDSTFSSAGLSSTDIANMKAAASYAAAQFTNNLNDGVNVNIKVTAVPGTGTLGGSNTFITTISSYTALRSAVSADAKTADDTTTLGAGGSVPTTDPIGSSHVYMVSRAEAKALGLIPDDLSNDGTFTFGGGYNYTYDPANRAVAGKFDFIGVAMHEFSEIMGRIPLMGQNLTGSPDYMLMDLFHYTGPGSRGLNAGPGRSFSINNGTTLLKAFNNASANGGDLQDWASGTNDAFNAFSGSSVENDLTAVDLRVMDVIGYNAGNGSPTPTPAPTPTPTPGPAGAAVMTGPAPGSTFSFSSVTFQWTAGNATTYGLVVGNSIDSREFYAAETTALSATVNGLPTDGRTIFVTLYSKVNNSWVNNRYTYTAFDPSATPTPTPVPTPTPTPTPAATPTPTPTPGPSLSSSNILVSIGNPIAGSSGASEMNSVREFTPTGSLVRIIPFNYNGGTYPTTEYLRHIVVDGNGEINGFNGTFSPYMTRYSPTSGTFTHTAFAAWDTVNSTIYGGIAAYQNFVYVTDVALGNANGIVRFDTSTNSAQRFSLGIDYADVTLGLDGSLYALADNFIDVFDPLTMAFVRRIIIPNSITAFNTVVIAAVTVDQSGQLFLAGTNGTVFRADGDGNLITSKATGFTQLTDIHIDEAGALILGQQGGRVVLGDSTLNSFTSFLAVNDPDVSAWTIFVEFTRALPIGSPTPTPTPTPTPRPTPTPTPTPTPIPTPTATPTPTPGPAAVMTSPAPGSTFSSSTVTFQWTAGSATTYALKVGSSPGALDFFGAETTSRSVTVNGIATDGRTIYVALYSKVNNSWLAPNSYTYTAFNSSGTPTPRPTATPTATPTPTPTATPTPTPTATPRPTPTATPMPTPTATPTATPTPANTVSKPTITPISGTYSGSVSVHIFCSTSGATIHYTLDGSTPTAASPTYSGSFTISTKGAKTVKAIGTKSGMSDSAVATANYTIN